VTIIVLKFQVFASPKGHVWGDERRNGEKLSKINKLQMCNSAGDLALLLLKSLLIDGEEPSLRAKCGA
jgi:hypothetical protein